MADRSRIVIVGAGVIGLTSALILATKGHRVTIVSEHLPGDKDEAHYTSSRAGAHFRPFPSYSESDIREQGYTRETQAFFKRFSWEYPESTIKFVKGSDWLENPSKGYVELYETYKGGMNNFRVIQHMDNIPKGVKMACTYDTWVLNAPMYIEFLYRLLVVRYGVEFKRQKLNSLNEVYSIFGNVGGVINATAFGLQFNGGYDPSTYPIRGQILILRIPPDSPYVNHTVTHQGADGNWTYVISRPHNGGCVLGGTKSLNDLDLTNRPEDIEAIKKRARVIFPELFVKENADGTKDLDIISTSVGFRPGRKGGSRVEAEHFGNKLVVHAYGIGGMGFESSYGMASHAVSILEKELSAPKASL